MWSNNHSTSPNTKGWLCPENPAFWLAESPEPHFQTGLNNWFRLGEQCPHTHSHHLNTLLSSDNPMPCVSRNLRLITALFHSHLQFNSYLRNQKKSNNNYSVTVNFCQMVNPEAISIKLEATIRSNNAHQFTQHYKVCSYHYGDKTMTIAVVKFQFILKFMLPWQHFR